jgi:hypothetical protein
MGGFVESAIIPKGFRTIAQGCRAAATLGRHARLAPPTPKGLRRVCPIQSQTHFSSNAMLRRVSSILRNPVGVFVLFHPSTHGSLQK